MGHEGRGSTRPQKMEHPAGGTRGIDLNMCGYLFVLAQAFSRKGKAEFVEKGGIDLNMRGYLFVLAQAFSSKGKAEFEVKRQPNLVPPGLPFKPTECSGARGAGKHSSAKWNKGVGEGGVRGTKRPRSEIGKTRICGGNQRKQIQKNKQKQ